MKNLTFIVFVMLLANGCVSLFPPKASDIVGEWRFTYVQKARTMFEMNPTPPSFDIINFKKDGSVHLVDSLMQRDFTGTYKMDKNILTWQFQPVDVKKPIKHRLECLWTENGNALVFRFPEGEEGSELETEWVYYRPDRLPVNDEIIGEWIVQLEKKTGSMTFKRNGTYYIDKKIRGYYRLWESSYGPTVTTPIWIEGHGGFMLLYVYKIYGNKMNLTPLTPKGLEDKGLVILNRSEKK